MTIYTASGVLSVSFSDGGKDVEEVYVNPVPCCERALRSYGFGVPEVLGKSPGYV